MSERSQFNVLSLDGGGSKGVYTLGVLKEFEAACDRPLSEFFQLIYGTSTGAIIASLLALGKSVSEIQTIYSEIIPRVMSRKTSKHRSSELEKCANEVFGESKFDAFKTGVGIVATNNDKHRPMIFKSAAALSYTMRSTFALGFGCTIAEALMASTAATPFFLARQVKTAHSDLITAIDGGFVANNPTLFAINDAVKALGIPENEIKVLNVGVGHYVEPQQTFYAKLLNLLPSVRMVQDMFETSSNTVDIVRGICFPSVECIRVDQTFSDPRYATDLLEHRPARLTQLTSLGRDSYSYQEKDIVRIFLKGNEIV
ncbi:MAG: patatin-like phospholipase family protein [Burkholderiales bacterium]|nr:patatin-like phospholipase family protein [Burkholderiales bacterium]